MNTNSLTHSLTPSLPPSLPSPLPPPPLSLCGSSVMLFSYLPSSCCTHLSVCFGLSMWCRLSLHSPSLHHTLKALVSPVRSLHINIYRVQILELPVSWHSKNTNTKNDNNIRHSLYLDILSRVEMGCIDGCTWQVKIKFRENTRHLQFLCKHSSIPGFLTWMWFQEVGEQFLSN